MQFVQRNPNRCEAIKIGAGMSDEDFADWPGVSAAPWGASILTPSGNPLPVLEGRYLFRSGERAPSASVRPTYSTMDADDFERQWAPAESE